MSKQSLTKQEIHQIMVESLKADCMLGEYQIRLNLGEVSDERADIFSMAAIVEALGWDETLRIIRNIKTGRGAIHFPNPFMLATSNTAARMDILLQAIFEQLDNLPIDPVTNLMVADIACITLRPQLTDETLQEYLWEMSRWRLVDEEEGFDDAMFVGFCFYAGQERLRLFIEDGRMLNLWKIFRHEYQRFKHFTEVEIPLSMKEMEEHPERGISIDQLREEMDELFARHTNNDNKETLTEPKQIDLKRRGYEDEEKGEKSSR